MKKVQRFIGVGDSKPASVPLSTSPGNSFLSAGLLSSPYASTPTTPGAAAAAAAGGASVSYDVTASRLLPPTQSMPDQRPQISPQSSQVFATPQPTNASAQQQYFDLPISAVSPSPRSVSPLAMPSLSHSASSSALNPTSSAADVQLVERSDLHKSLKALESLLVNLDEYRDLSARLAKVEKKLAKSTSELERTKVVLETPSQTLQLTSTMFEGLADVSSRHAKHVQREYEAVNDACAKYFKKVAKEERAHDELVQTLDAKIKKANAAHEKNVKKATANKALESHDKYIATVQALTNDISRAKNAHALSMAAKSHASSLLVASTVGGLADVEFKSRCESVRRVGPHVGRLNQLLCFTSSEFMPALQAAEFKEVEHGQAEYLAGLAAQVEASVAAQAQINAKVNEDTQTILRAQEMGWRPPSPLAPPTSASVANLGRSTSINSNASRATDAVAAPRSTSLQLKPERDSARSRSNSSSNVTASPSSSAPIQSDAASVHSIATDQTPRAATNGTATEAQPSSTQSGTMLSAPMPGASLIRAASASTIKSMAAQPQSWDRGLASSSSSAVGGRTSSATLAHDRDRTDSSVQEGSIVDKLVVPREDSDAAPPSLSATNSAQGSEDGNRIPRTPDESEPMPLMQSGHKASFQQLQKERDTFAYGNAEHTDRSRLVSSPKLRPAERALEQYRELTTRPETSPTASRFDRDSIASSQLTDSAADDANARKISLWERERERMRQIEREEGLAAARAPVSATYSRPPSVVYSSNTSSSAYNDNGGWSRSKISDGDVHDRGAGSQLGLGYPRPSGADAHDLDRYAPAVGSTRLSATGVARSLSTDTTASERSFVARMKARYQAEKDLEREHRELNVLEKERAARRATMDPTLSLPSMSGVRSRVPEIASRYQSVGAGTYPQEVSSGRRYHDSLPANAPPGGSGGVGSRNSAKASALSAAAGNGSVEEFGGIIRDSRSMASGRRSMEPPHSDVCGCHQCSARHYGSGTTRMDNSSREQDLSANARSNPREFNVRHTSMPVLPRQSQQAYAKHQQPQHQQVSYASSSPRAAPRDAYSYRDQQHLGALGGRDAPPPRRSYDEVDSGSRRVAFVQEPQRMR
ncbi:hypothetical protein EX895_003611 [Sporisorium graminicola]|uniref:Uncharacterized protein n=1 Tax=Sporisorium graminicola TaxID=280036 RepID=A0A4U7KU40_9BASI|nr:hypothetical protein EX895_003611 [Sporisorium graminicola]TKY87597.1 hypothetical protein EX895_003611 [Sporisorium graminicola]